MNGNEVPLTRAIRGPVMLITLGSLFALSNHNYAEYSFWKTFPVLLIVFGLLTLLQRASSPPPQSPAAWPVSPTVPQAPPQSGSYRQSGYTGTEPPAPPAGGAA